MQVLYQIMSQTVSSVRFSQLHSDIRTCWAPALLRDLQFRIQETHTVRSKSTICVPAQKCPSHSNPWDVGTPPPAVVPMVEDEVRLQVGWPPEVILDRWTQCHDSKAYQWRICWSDASRKTRAATES